mmetsp:Transcript_20750/g.46248  ORF Transcript_20750/g.46248 Transcript_20750/m.46248 type:complete len:536 (-) Transcript_20750:74-1681(-)
MAKNGGIHSDYSDVDAGQAAMLSAAAAEISELCGSQGGQQARRLFQAITSSPVNLQFVSSVVFDGLLPETGCDTLRTIVWKLLVQYYPLDPAKWGSHVTKKRQEYHSYVKDFVRADVFEQRPEWNDGALAEPASPRSAVPTDIELLDQIRKDVIRTQPDLPFFSTEFRTQDVESWIPGSEIDIVKPYRHCDLLARILFVFAKLNPGLSYVQGMNELAAVIYHVLSLETHSGATLEHKEADVFHLFTSIMVEQRDVFVKSLDFHDTGMYGRIRQMNDILRRVDPEVHRRLETNRVDPTFYSVRWITILFSQDFPLSAVVTMWDCFLADPGHPHPLADYVCAAIAVALREELLQGDFTANMHSLQRLPPEMQDGVPDLMAEARRLRAKDENILSRQRAAQQAGQAVRQAGMAARTAGQAVGRFLSDVNDRLRQPRDAEFPSQPSMTEDDVPIELQELRSSDKPGVYVVIGSAARVRTGPALNSPQCALLERGESLGVSEIRGRRGRLSWPVQGWVSLRTTDGEPILQALQVPLSTTL